MLITEEGKAILKTIITKHAKDSKGKIPENAPPRPIFFPKSTDLRNSPDFQNPHLKKSVITANSLLLEIFRMA